MSVALSGVRHLCSQTAFESWRASHQNRYSQFLPADAGPISYRQFTEGELPSSAKPHSKHFCGITAMHRASDIRQTVSQSSHHLSPEENRTTTARPAIKTLTQTPQAVCLSVSPSPGVTETREQLARVPHASSPGVPASPVYRRSVFSLAGNHSRYTLSHLDANNRSRGGRPAFLLVYHQLRRHFHSYSRIAENLLRDPGQY